MLLKQCVAIIHLPTANTKQKQSNTKTPTTWLEFFDFGMVFYNVHLWLHRDLQLHSTRRCRSFLSCVLRLHCAMSCWCNVNYAFALCFLDLHKTKRFCVYIVYCICHCVAKTRSKLFSTLLLWLHCALFFCIHSQRVIVDAFCNVLPGCSTKPVAKWTTRHGVEKQGNRKAKSTNALFCASSRTSRKLRQGYRTAKWTKAVPIRGCATSVLLRSTCRCRTAKMSQSWWTSRQCKKFWW